MDIDGTFNVYSALGTLVYQENLAVAKGTNEIPLNLAKLTPGVYYTTLEGKESKLYNKLVIAK